MTAHHKPTDRRTLDLKDPSLLVGQAYVAGEWIDAPDGKTIPVTDPFDGALILAVPDLGPDAARQAIDTAHAVQKDWARRPAKERSRILKAWYDLIVANADDLALILTTEQGKPLPRPRPRCSRTRPISSGSRRRPSASTATSSRALPRTSASSCSSSRSGSAPRSRPGTFPTA